MNINANNSAKFNAPQTIKVAATKVKGLIKGRLARKALALSARNAK